MLKITRNAAFRWALAAQIVSLASLTVLVLWWRRFVLLQAEKLAEVEQLAGVTASAAHEQWEKTQRMFYAESAFFLALVLVSSLGLFWFYTRERRRTRSLEAFFASLTHELRTPLSSIRLQVESLAEGALPESSRPLVGRLLEDASRLEGEVEKTLELARIEGGGPLHTRAIDVRAWLERWLRNEQSVQSGRVRFQPTFGALASGEELIQADTGALQVILRNVIENALRHSGETAPTLTLRTSRDGERTRLVFRNPVAAVQREAIPARGLGELFHKGTRSSGAGVGLYLVRALMERMGGEARFARVGDEFEVALRFRSEAA